MSSRFELPTLEPMAAPAPPPPRLDERTLRAQEREAARLQGYEDGKAEAKAEVYAELQGTMNALQMAVAEMVSRRDELCDAVEPAAAALALAGAEQIVSAALDIRPELLENSVRGALRRLVERDHVTVMVNPADLDHMRVFATELVDQLGGIDALDVQAERRVAPGGVIVQTARGDVDARLETRIEQLGVAVRDALAR